MTILQDARTAFRALRAAPAFTLVVVLSLALGIGANTAVYTLLHASLWRPLPVPQPDRLVELIEYDAAQDHASAYGYPLYTSFRDALRPYADVIAIRDQQASRLSLDPRDTTHVERAIVESVSANYFSALRVGASEGRLFVDEDDSVSGGRAVAVISHAFRERRFSAATSDSVVIGRTLHIDDRPYTIVGVAADGFDGVEPQATTDVWLPVTASLPSHWITSHGSMVLRFLARMRPDADVGRATAIADVIYRRYLQTHVLPTMHEEIQRVFEGRHLRLRPAASGLATIGHAYRTPLLILMSAVAIILLLCCANVANLLLARQRARESEFAVRLSLGAAPGRLARELLTESIMLSAIGAACGLLFASWIGGVPLRLLPQERVPVALDLTPDARVFAFTAAVALLVSIAVGLVPALRAATTDTGLVLNRTTRGVVRARLGHWLVIAQLAGSLVLLVTAVLMTRTLLNLRDAPLGFRPAQLLTFDLSFPTTYPDPGKAALYARLRDRLTTASGVTGVTYSGESIYSNGGWSGEAWLPNETSTTRSHAVALLRVGPRFFDVIGITRARGRVFGDDDHRNDRQVVVINETFARQFFGTMPPIGRRVRFDIGGKKELTVIGVVKDVRHYGAREQPCGGRVAYLPESFDTPSGAFFVRGLPSLADVQRIVRDELRQAGSGVLLERLRPIDTDVADMVSRERMVGLLASGFALLALTIAAIGLFGVLAYGVAQRTAEIGLRAALGATPTSLMRMILRDALRLVVVGLILGLPIAIASTRVLATLLFEVTPTDAIALASAPLLLAIVAAIAAWLPARRAATIDPLIALRN